MKKVLVCILTLVMLFGFTGCELFHTCKYSQATCETAAICSCGKTRDKALGHTSKLGLCNRCGNFVNEYKSTINNISDELLDATNTISIAVEILYYRTPISTEDMNKFIQEVSKAKQSVDTALAYCGSIEELSTLKAYITNMKDLLDNISGNTVNTYWNSFQNNFPTYKENAVKANELLIEWNEKEILN